MFPLPVTLKSIHFRRQGGTGAPHTGAGCDLGEDPQGEEQARRQHLRVLPEDLPVCGEAPSMRARQRSDPSIRASEANQLRSSSEFRPHYYLLFGLTRFLSDDREVPGD